MNQILQNHILFAPIQVVVRTLCGVQQSHAATYSGHSVRIAVPVLAAYGPDIVAGAVSDKPTGAWGQHVLMDNSTSFRPKSDAPSLH